MVYYFCMRFLPVLLACLLLLGACAGSDQNTVPQKNLVIIMVDALRKDRLGVYGYHMDVSPNIDAFAESALVFDQAVSQSGWTSPSIVAFFTSQYPRDKRNVKAKPTFTQWLDKKGYQTCAVVANPLLHPQSGLPKGFDTYTYLKWKRSRVLVDRALQWLAKADRQKPFFLYLHVMDVHDPYIPPAAYLEKVLGERESHVSGRIDAYKKRMFEQEEEVISDVNLKELSARYDGEIAYFDNQFGRFIAGLKTLRKYDNSIIIVTSDHGDEFMEHGGIGHGHSVFDELIRIPLIIGGVEHLKGRRYTGIFEAIDLAPTLMVLLHIPLEYPVTGMSFADYLADNQPLKSLAYSEVHRSHRYQAGNWYLSARSQEHKVIYSPVKQEYLLFDLSADHKEQNPLNSNNDEAGKRLEKALRTWRQSHGSSDDEEEYSDKTLEAMRALGYIQ